MASITSNIPFWPTLFLASATEAFIITFAIPKYLPHNPFVWTFVRTIAVNLLFFVVYRVLIYPFFVSPLRHLPRPKGGLPFVGNGLVLFAKPPGQDFLKWVTEIKNDGLIHFRGILHRDILLLTSPKSLADVLVQKSYDFEKPIRVRDFLRRILGNGLIITEGDEHKFQRKHIMPVFSFRHIKELYPMMWKKAVALTEVVAAEVKESAEPGSDEKDLHAVVEINHWANKVTMDIIGVAGLGREFNALKNSDDELIQNYEEILEPTAEKAAYFACQIIFGPIILKTPWRMNERLRVTTGNLNRITSQLVRDKREAIKANADENFDILSVLIKSDDFSDQELVDQMLTFLAAGHETTSSAFTWATYLLATHPDIQTRLRQEVRENIPSSPDPEVELAQLLESLPLLNAICNETLRLYPTVPITVRDTVRPTTINDTFVPVGTQLIISPWAINRSPELWGENASKFVPDRWINEDGKPNNNGGAESNYAITTFLHGPRSCIGGNFAKAELRCLLAAFVGAFEMELGMPQEKIIPAGVITTKPRDGMSLKLKLLKSW